MNKLDTYFIVPNGVYALDLEKETRKRFPFLKQFIPPFMQLAYDKMKYLDLVRQGKAPRFEDGYESFQQAKVDSDGYEDDRIISKCLKDARVNWARKEWAIESRELTFLQAFALAAGALGPLSVLDVGGSIGYQACKYRSLLPNFIKDWQILETEPVAEAMTTANSPIHYLSRLDEVRPFDFALISGSLQYLEDPYGTLTQIATKAKFVLIARTPIWSKPTKAFKQTAPRHTYDGHQISYPCRIFNRGDILFLMKECGYELLMKTSMPEDKPYIPGHGFLPYTNLLFKVI